MFSAIGSCALGNGVPRSGLVNFTPLSCTAIMGAQLGSVLENCVLLNGNSYTILDEGCGNINFPLLFDGAGINPSADMLVTCTDGVLSVTGGGQSVTGFSNVSCPCNVSIHTR